MKKTIILFVFSIVVSGLYAQKNSVEVLYFKAKMGCCQSRACNTLEADVKGVIEKNFKGKNVAFKQVAMADAANKALVEKCNAKAQTVVLIATDKKNKETSVDVSDIVRRYTKGGSKEVFEKELTDKINEMLKVK